MRLAPARPSRLAAAAAALALALAGCGGEAAEPSAAPSPAGPESSAPSGEPNAAEESPTGNPTADEESSAAESPLEVVAGTSAAAEEAGTARIALRTQVEVDGQEQAITGEGEIDYANAATALRFGSAGADGTAVSFETVSVGGEVFVRGIPGVPEGNWVRIPREQAAALGLDSSSSDPAQQLALLRSVGGEVIEEGPADVRGVATTRYTGTIDLQAALEQAQGDAEQQAEVRRALERAGVDTVPFEVYVDAAGRPARLVQTLTLSAEGQQVTTSTTVDFFDWGAPVDIAAPDESEIAEVPGG